MISIVIPALNEEKLIGRCLESLKNQDYQDEYEIIVVDNGSQDNTAKIARAMGAKVITCAKKGVSYARQAGAEVASGEIIVQADADTVYPEWWLSRIKKRFDSHPDIVAVAGTFIYSDPPWWACFEYFLRTVFGFLSNLVFGRPLIISGANFAFSREAFRIIGGYRPQSYSSDQLDISARLRKIGKIFFDGRSYGATSNRSVSKPTIIVFRDFVHHLTRFGENTIRQMNKQPARKVRSKSRITTGTYIKLLLPLILIGVLAYGYFIPDSPVFGNVYTRASASTKEIALTFDDGPNEPYTSQILDVLKAENIQATFFLIGKNVELYPDIARRIVAEGHVIGNHTYSHNANHAVYPNYYRDIRRAEEVIYQTTGVIPDLYRPPHGKKSPWELEAIKKEGYMPILWSIAVRELSGKPADTLAAQIIERARPGAIILLHDGYGTQHDVPRANKEVTVEVVKIVISELKDQGYQFVTVPQLLNIPAYNRTIE